jgi:hypothetical protein
MTVQGWPWRSIDPAQIPGSKRWWTQVGVSRGLPIRKCAGTQGVQSDLRCG